VALKAMHALELLLWQRKMQTPTEPFALLVGELAYSGPGGPELVYRFERFGE
jgi:hypothetical protein